MTLPGYEIGELLHEGALTRVYRARREQSRVPVVIKTLKAEYPSLREVSRLHHEYEIGREFTFDGIVRHYALEKQGNHVALVLEDFGGVPLSAHLGSKTGDLGFFLKLALRLAEILEQLQRKSIIHKDINPANIILNEQTGVAKLTDFGISSRLPSQQQEISHPEILEGTLQYMSPEQTGRMNRLIDYRTDFYSLGATLYEMLTGHPPFEAEDPMELVHCHLAKLPPPPCEVNPGTPQTVSAIVMKLLAKTAEERYQTAAGLHTDLEECLLQWKASKNIEIFAPGRSDVSTRFQIPEKLYGRELEITKLLVSFERVSTGITELLLVSGFSGIGKSALVHEVHRPITEKRGYFVSGKFEQFERDTPYAPLIQMFRELVRQLLTEREEELSRWKATLLDAVGPNGQIIIDVMPELQVIIGKQSAVPLLGPVETQNRFALVFRAFTRVFAKKEHPLVLFLDDLQWADPSSLRLIESILSDPESRYMLLIGAYRENEVGPYHTLQITVDELRKSGLPLTTISVRPLSLATINQLLSETLHCEQARSAPLAELVQKKTQGNCFFISVFLNALHREGKLLFDGTRQKWYWDLDDIERMDLPEDVADLMAGKIQQLSSPTQRALKLAACIGNRFDLFTLCLLEDQSPAIVASDLWEAVEEGLVLPLDDSYALVRESLGAEGRNGDSHPVNASFRFLHDRVQQTIYSLIPNDERCQLHLTIGRRTLAATIAEELDEKVFTIVNHLNAAQQLLPDDEERTELATLNLRAGRKARASAAFEPALAYVSRGIDLLTEENWNSHYELMRDLAIERAECEYLTGKVGSADEHFDSILHRLRTDLEKAKVHSSKVVMNVFLSNLEAAFQSGIEGLRLVGVEIPPKPGKLTVVLEILRVRWLLRGRKITDLLQLPDATDEKASVALNLLMDLLPAAYHTNNEFLTLIILRMIRLTLKYGNALPSSYGYALFGLFMGSGLGKYSEGYDFGKLALDVSEKFKNPLLKGRCYHVMGSAINHWKKPASTNKEYFTRAQQYCLESGDLLYTSYVLHFRNIDDVVLGVHTDQLIQNSNEFIDFVKQKNYTFYGHIAVRQMALCLNGNTDEPGTFGTADCDEEQLVEDVLATKNTAEVMTYRILKLQALYLFGQFDEAQQLSALCAKDLHGVFGQLLHAEFIFYSSLLILATHQTGDHAPRRDQRTTLSRNLSMLNRWAKHCPENFLHKELLVAAGIADAKGQDEKAARLYEQAIRSAEANGYLHIKALAEELTGMFLLRTGNSSRASSFMKEAAYGYERWGAAALATKIRREHPHFFTPTDQPPSPASPQARKRTSHVPGQSLDLISVLKASQALSGEIILRNLLEKMMTIVIENAGAERGSLVLETGGHFSIEAEVNTKGSAVRVHSTPFDQGTDLCQAIVQYAARTREPVVLHDALQDSMFAGDRYLMSARPKSILCVPILYQAKLIGVLYLENNLTTGAFTPDRLEVLQLLSSQIAISIENARLYKKEQALVRMHEEVRLASQIQQNLLPQAPPVIAGYEIAGVNIPAQVVGGDYFDFIQISEDRWAICLGDVSGKGLPASLLMANLQATLRGQTLLDAPPGECLQRSNKLLYQSTSPEKFATLFYGILDARRHTLHYSNAGQDNPFILNGGIQKLRLKTGGIPLGLMEEFSYDEEVISLDPGDTIVIYSDGIPEAMNERQEFFGEGELASLLAIQQALQPKELMEKIVEAVKSFTGTTPQSDDMTIVVIRRS